VISADSTTAVLTSGVGTPDSNVAVSAAAPTRGRSSSGGYEPRWLRVVALVPVLAVVAFGAVGLLLADLGWYQPGVVLVAGAAVLVGLCICARPLWRPDPDEHRVVSTGWGLAAVAVSIGYAIWNCANASEHVQINRDGGLLLNTGRWIAVHGSLVVEPFVGPFGASNSVVHTSNGMVLDGHHLEFSLSHALPALLAEAQNLGGDRLMFFTVPILSALAILAFFVLAARVIRSSAVALAATVCLAALMPQVSFSRDSTIEVPLQVLVFTAAWLLGSAATWRNRRTAFCAGFVLGFVQPLHVDGIAYIVGLPLVCAAVWLNGRRAAERPSRDVFLSLGAGVVSSASLSVLDLGLRDRAYLASVGGGVAALAGAMVVSVALAILIARIWSRGDVRRVIGRVREPASIFAGLTVVALAFGGWLLRPVLQKSHGRGNGTVAFVQSLGNLPVDATRKYAELSVRWVSWYLGPMSLTVAIVAAGAVAALLARGSLRFPTKVAVLMLAPPALLYLWRPSITPDHIWAMRRSLPAVLPGVVLLVFAAIGAMLRASPPLSRRVSVALAVVLGLYAVGYPVWATGHVSAMTEQAGEYAPVRALCRTLGPNSAVVILEESSFVHLNDPQTLRSFCNIPVAVMPGEPDAFALRDLARKWNADGRQLFVVSESPATIQRALPGVAVRVTPTGTNSHLLNSTLLWRPSHYTTESLSFATARVPTQ
jgi:hypothetical protein